MNHEKGPVCRVCLNSDRGIRTGIFEKSNETFVYEKLNLIANINIKPKDGLPDKICSDCLVELENAIIFKQKCETSNNILVSALHTNIGLPKQENEFLEKLVKDELDEYDEHEYLEDVPESPSEPLLKLEEPAKQEQPPSPPEIHLEPASRSSRAINMQLECHDCGNLFKSKCKLKVHWFKVHLKAQLTCNICEKVFGSFKKLKDHKINRTKRCMTLGQVRIEGNGKSRVYHCKECVHSTKYIDTMTKHLAIHSGERSYACTLCPATYRYINNFDAHMESKHGVKQKSVVCNICGKTMSYFKLHRHMKTHNAGDSVTCNICNKIFKYKSYMKVHMERHEGVKKYPCDKCGKSFVTTVCLINHIRQVHDCKKRRIYSCDVCEFTLNDKKKMNQHKLNHSKYHYVCTTCGKFFENATQLSCHEERHTNKNHPCQLCEKRFFTRKLLLSHMNKRHNVYSANLKKQTKS